MLPNSLVRVSLSCFAFSFVIVFLLKSKTSSLNSFKIFRVFSHFPWDSDAEEHISDMKLFQLTFQSYFTIDTKVAFNFEIKN